MLESPRPHIVFVDDDRTMAQLIKMLLELDDFRVSICADAAAARKLARGGADAFVIDCHLSGGKSGLDLLRDIRRGATPADRATPVIMASGDYLQEKLAAEAGSDRFIMKPFQSNELIRMLHRLLEKAS